MCGIAGMFGKPDINVVHRMNRYQVHRGPDGQDAWCDDNVALGHTRLAIVDRVGGDQPLFGPQGEVLIANGEIYNHALLRQKNTTYVWNTNVDSEAILALHTKAKQRSKNNKISPLEHA